MGNTIKNGDRITIYFGDKIRKLLKKSLRKKNTYFVDYIVLLTEDDTLTVIPNTIQKGDELPSIALGGAPLLEIELDLAPASLGLSAQFGASWTERVIDLRKAFGPFGLAFLEALLRAADIRVSKRDAPQG